MSNEMPLVIRCVNSTMVCAVALAPITSPLQTGHLLPQPAPEPVALTYAPQSTTATLKHRVTHAKHATGGILRSREWECGIVCERDAKSGMSAQSAEDA